MTDSHKQGLKKIEELKKDAIQNKDNPSYREVLEAEFINFLDNGKLHFTFLQKYGLLKTFNQAMVQIQEQ